MASTHYVSMIATMLIFTSAARSAVIRIPADSTYADTEGEGQNSVDIAAIGQQIHSKFDLPLEGPHILTSFAFRPDGVEPTPALVMYEKYELSMGVTEITPDTMSTVFANNRPADLTLVHQGPAELTTQNIQLPNGTFKFDQDVVFQVPFVYDPAEGNLFFEVDWSAPSEAPFSDFALATDLARSMDGFPGSVEGGSNGSFPLEFRFQTLEPGDADFDGDVDSADQTSLVANWTGARMLEREIVSGGWIPGDFDLDGDVDTADQTMAVTNWTGASMATGLGIVPEPSSLCLVLVGLAMLLTYRMRRRS